MDMETATGDAGVDDVHPYPQRGASFSFASTIVSETVIEETSMSISSLMSQSHNDGVRDDDLNGDGTEEYPDVEMLRWQEDSRRNVLKYALLNSRPDTGKDVTFLVGPEEEVVTAHSAFLVILSPIFRAVLLVPTRDPNDPIRLANDDPRMFKLLLEYIYLGSFDQDQVLLSEDKMKLLKMAKRYEIHELFHTLGDELKGSIQESNAPAILEIAIELEHKILKESAVHFICSHANQMLTSQDCLSLSRAGWQSIISSDLLCAREMYIIDASIRWAERRIRQQLGLGVEAEIHGSKIREEWGEAILHSLRFPLLDPIDFSNSVAQRNLLTDGDSVKIFMYLNGGQAEKLPYITQQRTGILTVASASPVFPPEMETDEIRVPNVNLSVEQRHAVSLVNPPFALAAPRGSYDRENEIEVVSNVDSDSEDDDIVILSMSVGSSGSTAGSSTPLLKRKQQHPSPSPVENSRACKRQKVTGPRNGSDVGVTEGGMSISVRTEVEEESCTSLRDIEEVYKDLKQKIQKDTEMKSYKPKEVIRISSKESLNFTQIFCKSLVEFVVQYDYQGEKQLDSFLSKLTAANLDSLIFIQNTMLDNSFLWKNLIGIDLMVNGITILQLDHRNLSVVLSRVRRLSKTILKGVTAAKEIHLEDININSPSEWKSSSSTLEILTLRNVKVKADGWKELGNVLSHCKNLTILSLYDMHNVYLDVKKHLRMFNDDCKLNRIALHQVSLGLDRSSELSEWTTSPVRELYLVNCTLSLNLISAVPTIFNNLRKFTMCGNVNLRMLLNILNIEALEWVAVWGFYFSKAEGVPEKQCQDYKQDEEAMKAVLREAGFKLNVDWIEPQEKTFTLKRKAKSVEGRRWRGTEILAPERDEKFRQFDFQEFDWDRFYSSYERFAELNPFNP